ncbi:MAG: penicillin-binding transpeptidase domain-containing protein [Bdellovibrionota bacterium]
MAQGEDTTTWGQQGHTALYTGFPAASIFKNVTAASALDILSFDEDKQIGLRGGCASVHSRGIWLKDIPPSRHYRMTLRLAYGRSCNGFFAKMAVNEVGLGSIEEYASRFGWGHIIPTDFKLKASPIIAPKAAESSIHTVGRFAAGFGLVGLSAMHAAWFTVAIANDGVPKKLTLFTDTPAPINYYEHRLFAKETGVKLRDINMKKTTNGGTASSVFRKRRYRKLKSLVGGKTGTLNGNAPKGLTNWFTGIMPLDNPEIAIAAVTVTGDLWFIKGPYLAKLKVFVNGMT